MRVLLIALLLLAVPACTHQTPGPADAIGEGVWTPGVTDAGGGDIPEELIPGDGGVVLHESFEGELPEIERWSGDCTINSLVATEERASDGRRSLKLDVTVDDGSHCYIGGRLNIPCEGKLTMSARIALGLGSSSGARAGFGANATYPPMPFAGCTAIDTVSDPLSDWTLMSTDAVAQGHRDADTVMRRTTFNVTGDDVGVLMDRWSVFIYASKGERVIVYLDDILIEGEVLSADEFNTLYAERFSSARARLDAAVLGWNKALDAARPGLVVLDSLESEAAELVDRVRTAEKEADDLIAAADDQGYASPADAVTISRDIATVRNGPAAIHRFVDARKKGLPWLFYTLDSVITNQRPDPALLPLELPVANGLSLSASRGEYESASLTVAALKDVPSLTITASDLKDASGNILPASALDLRIVKSWYQGDGDNISYTQKRALIPELLLYDDALVRADPVTQNNYLRSTAPDGTMKYLLSSGITEGDAAALKAARPVDAGKRLPVSLKAGTFREFWMTVHVPASAKPGAYTGALKLSDATGAVKSLPVHLTVHPFALLPPRLIYSIYYNGRIAADDKPTITSELKSKKQYGVEIADMLAHGVSYPSNGQAWDTTLLPAILKIRKDAGLPGGPFFNVSGQMGNSTDPGELALLRHWVKNWIALLKPYGYNAVYFYGLDEATGDKLASQRMAWNATHEAGGKTFVAGSEGMFEAMGGLLDGAILNGAPDPEEAVKWHSVGSLVFSYGNPQVGVEAPATYRRNFGLVLWKAGFDGAMDYAYQHGFGHVWNDFDDPGRQFRDHNFTYPTVDGVVGTLQWEGFREGVDDVRYITTLENVMKTATPSKLAIADEAQVWLDSIDPSSADLDQVRAKAVEWILKLL